jgi:hypothetical protein
MKTEFQHYIAAQPGTKVFTLSREVTHPLTLESALQALGYVLEKMTTYAPETVIAWACVEPGRLVPVTPAGTLSDVDTGDDAPPANDRLQYVVVFPEGHCFARLVLPTKYAPRKDSAYVMEREFKDADTLLAWVEKSYAKLEAGGDAL